MKIFNQLKFIEHLNITYYMSDDLVIHGIRNLNIVLLKNTSIYHNLKNNINFK